jgi:uncharacterized membrane protein AbrB (regulator of aidB expression)
VISHVHPILALIAGLLVAGVVHSVKALAVRPAITATTAGVGNVPASIAEDLLSTILSIIAAVAPVVVAVILVLSGALLVWWIWGRITRLRARV